MPKPSERPSWQGTAAACKFTFIQRMMVNSCCTVNEAKEFVNLLLTSSSDQRGETYEQFIRDINTELSDLKFQLRTIQPPGENQQYIGLVNRDDDEASKQGSKSRPAEREYIRAVLQHIAKDPSPDENGVARVPSSALLNLKYQCQDAGKALTRLEKEKVLKQMVDEGWLASTGAGRFKLGPRTFLEMDDYLMRHCEMPEQTLEAWKAVLE